MAIIQAYLVQINIGSYTNKEDYCFGIENVYSFIQSDPVLQIPSPVLDALAPRLFYFALESKDNEINVDLGIQFVNIYIKKNGKVKEFKLQK
jgi:hypothetical protein